MKVSILLPSLYPVLAQRLMSYARNVDFPNYEFVVCSPQKIEGDRVVWVEDPEPAGTGPAIRRAFQASTGEIIVVLCDDVLLVPRWLDLALFEFLTSPFDLWGLGREGYLTCFNRYYASFPVCGRFLVERHWNHFFPYTSHFGDPAFSLAVWRAGGTAREMKEKVIIWSLFDRSGQPEAATSLNPEILQADKERLLRDFPDFAKGWSTDYHDFLAPRPP